MGMATRAAFAVWGDRIAPVFDAACRVRIVEVDSGRIVREADEGLPEPMPTQRALRLAELGIDTLVCGAISRPMLSMITGQGIRVVPFVSGEVRRVIAAWLRGSLEDDLFAMPGIRARSGRCRRGEAGRRFAGGPGGECVCSACGHHMRHERGKPCQDTPCPKCGAVMVRG